MQDSMVDLWPSDSMHARITTCAAGSQPPGSSSAITSTPLTISVHLLDQLDHLPRFGVQNLWTELESIFYSPLQVATADRLHWKHCNAGTIATFDCACNLSVIVCEAYFHKNLLSCIDIYLPDLHDTLKGLRRPIFPGASLPDKSYSKRLVSILSRKPQAAQDFERPARSG